jgi:dTDP-glucose 4,6-dehydratase
MTFENILVLGANSFSGSTFASRLPLRYKKHLVFRTPASTELFTYSRLENETQTKWNLNEDCGVIVELILQNRIEIVVNFAAQSMVGQSWDQPEDWYEANNMSFSKLLNSIHKYTDISKFIQFSTPEVYGSTNSWIKESFNFAPNTPYAVSRAASDWHLKALHDHFGFPVIFTRAANVFGERQRLYRVIPRVIFSALTGQKVPLHGGGESIRSFIHIADVCDALLKIVELGETGESYHISTYESIRIIDLVAMIASKLKVKIEDLIEVAPDRPGKDNAYLLDSRKIRDDLGWIDQITLSEGIDRTIKWVEDNLNELAGMPLNYEHRR